MYSSNQEILTFCRQSPRGKVRGLLQDPGLLRDPRNALTSSLSNGLHQIVNDGHQRIIVGLKPEIVVVLRSVVSLTTS